jgi:cell division protease FtsH
MALPLEDRNYLRRSEMVDKLAMMLGGRTAEEIMFLDPTTGASNDIEQATKLARRMVMEYGMSDRLGPMKYGQPAGEVFLGRDYNQAQDYSDAVASIIDEEVRYLITQAHEEARTILTTHAEALDRIADALKDRETLDAKDVREIFFDVPKWQHATDGSMRIQAPNGKVAESPVTAVKASTEEVPPS